MDCLVSQAEAARRVPSREGMLRSGSRVLRRWSGPVALAVADQGLASGVHFGLSLLLARWLAPPEYGAFAFTYALLLLSAGLHTAILLEPMGVIGPAHHAARLPAYLGVLVWLHAGLTLVIAILFLAAAAAMAVLGSALWPALAAVSGAAPGILLSWLFRRACYLAGRPDVAARGGAAYAALIAGGMALLWRFDLVSTASPFLLMGGAGVVVSVMWGRRLGVEGRDLVPGACLARMPAVVHDHWAYARWSVGTTVLYWLSSSIYLPLVGTLAGLQAVATYRAADNLMLPMGQVLTALGMLLLPWLSGQQRIRGRGYLGRAAVKLACLGASAAAAWAAGILLFAPQLMRLLYGGDQYSASLALLPHLGVAVVLRAVGDTGFGIALRAAGRPHLAFWATAAGAAVTLTAGLALVSRYGAVGAAAGWMASAAASCAASGVVLLRRVR